MSSGQRIGVGVGLTAAAVAAAGSYFLYGSKNAAKNRKQVKSWMLKAKAEVLEQLEDAKEMSQEEYESLINSVASGYATLKSATNADLRDFKKEMKEHWQAIENNAVAKKKSAKKTAKKVAKKTVKKVAKKVTPKKTTKKKK